MLDRKKIILISLMLLALILGACGKQKNGSNGKTYKIYYVNRDETGVLFHEYVTETTDRDELVREFLGQMETGSEKLEYKAPLSGTFNLINTAFSEVQLILNFDENYRLQPPITEILVRAALVRTLTQIEEIEYVSFQVNSEPLMDASGALVGVMNADQFIDNAGNEINTYEKVKLNLYLANEEGTGLNVVTRTVVYNSNISMERLVVEQLIAGPFENEAAYPTINPNTRVVSVNVQDGICYVNLNSAFLTQIYNVTSDVTIYSITNSLVELTTVNKVQISIDGDSNVNFKENTNLSTVFERNLEIVVQ